MVDNLREVREMRSQSKAYDSPCSTSVMSDAEEVELRSCTVATAFYSWHVLRKNKPRRGEGV